MRLLRSLARDRKGSAAIEFAILALPFFVVIFAIAEIAVMYFVDSGLDAAVHKAVRQVRVGVAKSGNWDAAKFKQVVCGELSYSFDCTSKLKVRATVITDMASITKASPISSGSLAVTEDFDLGDSKSYVLVQAFLPWNPTFKLYALSTDRLSDGSYVLGSAELIKNEPF
ncbi:MAG: pilus assembly protein [Rhizobiaceae bacterium]|nr:pilus assembly protein [Rhizobiaceae bacterium]